MTSFERSEELDIDALIEAARSVQGRYPLAFEDHSAASVGAALLSASGNIHTGVCFDVSCGIGFCAEHAAIAGMLETRETRILAIVAVNEREVIPPCGRCRELISQLCPENSNTQVVLPGREVCTLQELLPRRWTP